MCGLPSIYTLVFIPWNQSSLLFAVAVANSVLRRPIFGNSAALGTTDNSDHLENINNTELPPSCVSHSRLSGQTGQLARDPSHWGTEPGT